MRESQGEKIAMQGKPRTRQTHAFRSVREPIRVRSMNKIHRPSMWLIAKNYVSGDRSTKRDYNFIYIEFHENK